MMENVKLKNLDSYIPYGRQMVDEADVKAVCDVLRSDWLTTGPTVEKFEKAFAKRVGAKCASAVCSGTAALHCIMFAIGIHEGDEVILPPITFAATGNAILYQGGTPVFVDVNRDDLLIDVSQIEKLITKNTKAIIGVDYAGNPCNYTVLKEIAKNNNVYLISDGCHALGGSLKDSQVGNIADFTAFSFHPVKHIATGEGGMVTTNDENAAEKINSFRNHGIDKDHSQRKVNKSHYYEMTSLGYNYRLSDINCALGLSQLDKLDNFLERRRKIAFQYNQAFENIPEVVPLKTQLGGVNAYHLYVIRLQLDMLRADRDQIFLELREADIGVNVHYLPVYLHPYFEKHLGYTSGLCPVAEDSYRSILSLPIFPGMSDNDVSRVVDEIEYITQKYKR